MHKDYYFILGVPEDATKEEIRRAYIKLAREYHPDKQYGNDDWNKLNEEFSLIVEAYNVLIDTQKRKEYDQYLSDLRSGKLKEADKKKEHAKRMYKNGKATYKKGENERALGYFKAAVQFDGSNPLYHSYYGLLLIIEGKDIEEGWKEIKKAIQESMEHEEIVINYGKASILADKEKEALPTMKNAIKWFPKNKEILELAKEVEKSYKRKNNPLLKLFRRK